MIRQIFIYDTLNTEGRVAIPLEDCISANMSEQIITRTKGYFTLEIVFPLENPNAVYFKNERNILIGTYNFVIKKITKRKSTNKTITIECESIWYQLSDGDPILQTTNFTAGSARIQNGWVSGNTRDILGLFGSFNNWNAGLVENSKTHRFKITDGASWLYMIRYLAKLSGNEIFFNTQIKRIDFVTRVGTDTNVSVSYDKNLKGITKIEDSTKLATRIYMYGADGATIAPINSGRPWIQDQSYFIEQNVPLRTISHVIVDERFSVPAEMFEYMKQYRTQYMRPIVSYELEQYLLDDILNVGDSIIIQDQELGLQARHRIIERNIDLIYPEQSTYVLDNEINDLTNNLEDDDYFLNLTSNSTTTTTAATMQTDLTNTKIQELELEIANLKSEFKSFQNQNKESGVQTDEETKNQER